VLQADSQEIRNSRLALASLTLKVLLNGLELLGIPVPDRM
jgi:arginyl-tRNA synthetase